MNPTRFASVVALLALTGAAYAQSSPSPSPTSSPSENASTERVENGVPVSRFIVSVAKKTGKKFVIDPKVHGEIELIGADDSNISYSDLLTILHTNGLTAVEYGGGYVSVIPEAAVRQAPLPVLSGKETRPDAQFVTRVISVKNVPAAQLVPILRPMLPQVGHLAALPCVNKLIIVDTDGNVRRIESVIDSLDVGEPYKPNKCEGPSPSDHP